MSDFSHGLLNVGSLVISPSATLRGLGSIIGVAGIGYYSSRDIETGRQYIVYVFEIENSSTSWLIYRRYSQISELASAISTQPNTNFPPKYSLQPYALTDDQLRERFASLRNWMEQLYDTLQGLYSQGFQHGDGSFGLDMQIFYDFISSDANLPPSYLRSIPEWARPTHFELKSPVLSTRLVSSSSSLETEMDSKSNQHLHQSFEMRNQLLKMEASLAALKECMKTFLSKVKAQSIASLAVAEEIYRVYQGCMENDLTLNVVDQKKKQHSNVVVVSSFDKEQPSLLKDELVQIIASHKHIHHQVVQDLELACEDKLLTQLELLCKETLPMLKNQFWEGTTEIHIDEEKLADMRLALSLLQQQSSIAVQGAIQCLTQAHRSFLMTSLNQINQCDHPSHDLSFRLETTTTTTTFHDHHHHFKEEEEEEEFQDAAELHTPISSSAVSLAAISPTRSNEEEDEDVNEEDVKEEDVKEEDVNKCTTTSSGEEGKSDSKTIKLEKEENRDVAETELGIPTKKENENNFKMWGWGRLPEGNGCISVLRPRELHILPGINIVQVACGGQHVLYLTDSRDVYYYGWGDRKSDSKLPTSMDSPQLVQGLTLNKALEGRRVCQIACGAQHSVAITDAGELYTWGSGEDGRLGHGDLRDRVVPRKVMGLLGKVVRQASCGGAHTVVVTEDHEVYSWGRGRNGRLGHGDSHWRDSPKCIGGLLGLRVTNVHCGWNFTVAVTEDGRIYSWGKQGEGQCGIGLSEVDKLVPCRVNQLRDEFIVQVACGYTHTLALSRSQKLFSWGLGEYGQLGKGGVYQPVPEPIDLSPVLVPNDQICRIFCGAFHSIVSTAYGVILAWGLNTYGSLGLGHTINRDIPERIDCFRKECTLQVSCGDNFTILLEQEKLNCSSNDSNGFPVKLKSLEVLNEITISDMNTVKKSKEKERDLRRAKRIWRTKILPEWDQGRNTHLTHTMWCQGIPPTIRAHVWPLAIGNSLKITPEMFHIYKERALSHHNEPNHVCAIGREFSMKLIHTDLPRTFPALRLFDESGPYYNILLELLATYACYRPDLGYIQGMSYLAAMLCLYMPDDSYMAFQCLANLIVSQHLFTFYLLDVDLAESYYSLYSNLLQSHSRPLYLHLLRLGISPSVYLMSWLQTLFLQVLPLEIASRVWDCFLLDGTVFLFRTALAIQDILSPLLLKSDVDECIPLLQRSRSYHTIWNEAITEEQLFNTIATIHVPSKIYRELDRLIDDVYFYSKEKNQSGYSVSVAKVKQERKIMYYLGDKINGILGGL